MGFFDSLSELLEAATPWSSVEAEAPTTGGASDKSTPATQDGGEGEAEDADGPTPDKSSTDSGNDAGGDDEEEEEEEEEEEIVDPKEALEEECKESKGCAPYKHHFDECVERVTSAADEESDKKHPGEDCVEEFFHLAHCANQCAAPKLWAALK